MSLSDLFIRVGAPLANQRWSWGALRADGAVVLRVWQDRKEKIDGKWCMMVVHHEKYDENADALGYRERLAHVEAIRSGSKCFMIMCLAIDTKRSPRKVQSFNDQDIFVGGALLEHQGNTYIELVDRYAISRLTE